MHFWMHRVDPLLSKLIGTAKTEHLVAEADGVAVVALGLALGGFAVGEGDGDGASGHGWSGVDV